MKSLLIFFYVAEEKYYTNMGERYNIHSQLEHLQSKYIGTGHADTTKYEWMTNQVISIYLWLNLCYLNFKMYFVSIILI